MRPTFNRQPRSWCCLDHSSGRSGSRFKLNGEICRLVPDENRFNDIGTETGERQKSADLCGIEAFIGHKGFERNDLPGDQLMGATAPEESWTGPSIPKSW